MLRLQLFGRLHITRNNQHITTFRSTKGIGLLLYLVLESRTAHARTSLATLLWSEMDGATGRRNLTQSLRRIRNDLDDKDKQSRYFDIQRQTLAICNDASIECDVLSFWGLQDEVTAHDHHDLAHCAACQEKLQQAAALANGELLSGFDVGDSAELFEEWLLLLRERVHQQRLNVLAAVTEGALADARYDDALRWAREQIALESWRESAHQQLITALYATKKRAAALAQYDKLCQILWNELGVQPSAATEALLERVRQTDGAQTHTLPTRTTPFIGRERELAQLAQRLTAPTYRLITLVGPGGIGKTRLALEVAQSNADHFRDGVFFVPLEGVADADDIPAAIAAALNLVFLSEGSPHDQLIRALKERQLLLIIDNLEHIVQAGTPLLLDILSGAPNVILLVTSRQELNAQSEDLFRLRGLPYPEEGESDLASAGSFAAVRLFVERAHRLSKRFKLTADNVAAVCAICHLV